MQFAAPLMAALVAHFEPGELVDFIAFLTHLTVKLEVRARGGQL